MGRYVSTGEVLRFSMKYIFLLFFAIVSSLAQANGEIWVKAKVIELYEDHDKFKLEIKAVFERNCSKVKKAILTPESSGGGVQYGYSTALAYHSMNKQTTVLINIDGCANDVQTIKKIRLCNSEQCKET